MAPKTHIGLIDLIEVSNLASARTFCCLNYFAAPILVLLNLLFRTYSNNLLPEGDMFLNFDIPQVTNPFKTSNGFLYGSAAADKAFYDVDSLNKREFNYLVEQTTVEGAILVALPSGRSEMGIIKYKDFAELKAGGGTSLKRFSVAGVGSSDVGAAALARTLADFYQEPVGAIVAGYGVADMMQEAMGGWFALGGLNRAMSFFDSPAASLSLGDANEDYDKVIDKVANLSPDTKTLLALLNDADRKIVSLVGHSKGALSISLALQALGKQGNSALLKKAKNIDLVTFGAVVDFPEGFESVRQFLGAIDWFGGMNSQSSIAHERVPNAWHHLNTSMPYHLDVVKVLEESEL